MMKRPLPRQVFFEQLQHIQIIPLDTFVTAFWNDRPTASIFCTILSLLCIFIRPIVLSPIPLTSKSHFVYYNIISQNLMEQPLPSTQGQSPLSDLVSLKR